MWLGPPLPPPTADRGELRHFYNLSSRRCGAIAFSFARTRSLRHCYYSFLHLTIILRGIDGTPDLLWLRYPVTFADGGRGARMKTRFLTTCAHLRISPRHH